MILKVFRAHSYEVTCKSAFFSDMRGSFTILFFDLLLAFLRLYWTGQWTDSETGESVEGRAVNARDNRYTSAHGPRNIITRLLGRPLPYFLI